MPCFKHQFWFLSKLAHQTPSCVKYLENLIFKKKQAQLGVSHSRIQVELGFILQAGTCQILNFAQNLRQSQSVQGTELNWGRGTPHRESVYREGGHCTYFLNRVPIWTVVVWPWTVEDLHKPFWRSRLILLFIFCCVTLVLTDFLEVTLVCVDDKSTQKIERWMDLENLI